MEDTVLHKPDPEPLLLAVNRLGATPDQAVYVGDAIVDVQAARNAGMAAVAVTWGAGVREALEAMAPDVVAETVDDLREALLPTRATNSGSR
jgi:pyrophosphatase PpaX